MADPSTLPDAVLQKALAACAAWLRRPYVRGLGISTRIRAGERLDEVCLQVLVEAKHGPAALQRSRRKPFPEAIEVIEDERRWRIPVDVVDSPPHGDEGFQTSAIGGTCRVDGLGLPVATGRVAAALGRDSEPTCYLLTAGHVGERPDRTVQVAGLSGSGTVKRVYFSSWHDFTLVAWPQTLSSAEVRLRSGAPLQPFPMQVTPSLQGKAVYCELASTKQVHVTSVFQTVKFPLGGGRQLAMRDLVGIEPRFTGPGDSGALLYDGQMRAIGTLVGVIGGSSYFIPCERLFGLSPYRILR